MVKFSSNRGGVRNLIVDIDSNERPDFQNSATIQLSNVTVVPPPDVTDCPTHTVPTHTVPSHTVPTHTVPPRVVTDFHLTASGISGKVPQQTTKVSRQSGKVPQQIRKVSQQSGKVLQQTDNVFTAFL